MLSKTVTRGRANPLHWKFPDRLLRSRRVAGMHAMGLSRAAGLNKNAVAGLEAADPASGLGLPTLRTTEKLARALGLSPGWLAFGLGDAAAGAELLGQSLAERAKATRLERGLSALALAKAAGLTDGAVRSVEGGRQPSLSTLEALAVALGVSPSWLAWGLGDRELPRRGGTRSATLPVRELAGQPS